MKTIEPQTLSVLFVDDDPDEYYLFNEALEQSHLSVNMSRAQDGRQLLKLLNDGNLPDLIFMDLNMPYKDGVETLTEIKGNSNYNHIPVIIFSTSRNINYINSCYDEGASYYVVKPENFDNITKVVKKLFSTDIRSSNTPNRQSFVVDFK